MPRSQLPSPPASPLAQRGEPSFTARSCAPSPSPPPAQRPPANSDGSQSETGDGDEDAEAEVYGPVHAGTVLLEHCTVSVDLRDRALGSVDEWLPLEPGGLDQDRESADGFQSASLARLLKLQDIGVLQLKIHVQGVISLAARWIPIDTILARVELVPKDDPNARPAPAPAAHRNAKAKAKLSQIGLSYIRVSAHDWETGVRAVGAVRMLLAEEVSQS